MDKSWCKLLVLGVLGWGLHAASQAQTGARPDPGKLQRFRTP